MDRLEQMLNLLTEHREARVEKFRISLHTDPDLMDVFADEIRHLQVAARALALAQEAEKTTDHQYAS